MHVLAGAKVTPELGLVRPLGAGAMGHVWIADHAGLGKRVAVKFLALQLATDATALARFRREAAAAARLSDPHTVRCLDHGTTSEGLPFIVMELLEGESLGAKLSRDGRIDLASAARLVRHVGASLEEAHALGIVHRDIKADNVFLVRSERGLYAKVLDFGAAKLTLERSGSIVTATGIIVGTPQYMSPEHLLGSKELDHRTDLWALGVMTYRAIVGRMPFEGGTPHALVFAICKGAYEPPSQHGLPSCLDPWFARALSPGLDKRFSSAGELVHAFDRAVRKAGALEGDTDISDLPTMMVAAQSLLAGRSDGPTLEKEPADAAEDALDSSTCEQPVVRAPSAEEPAASSRLDGDTLERPATAGDGFLADDPSAISAEAVESAEDPFVPGSDRLPGERQSSLVEGAPDLENASTRPAVRSRERPAPPRAALARAWLFGAACVLAAGVWLVLRPTNRAGEATSFSSADRSVAADPRAGAVASSAAAGDGPARRTGPSSAGQAPAIDLDGQWAEGAGRLSVDCAPRCEDIWIGDRLLGPSPIEGVEVPAGEHLLSLSRSDRPTTYVRVRIEAGRETRQSFSLVASSPAGAAESPGATDGDDVYDDPPRAPDDRPAVSPSAAPSDKPRGEPSSPRARADTSSVDRFEPGEM